MKVEMMGSLAALLLRKAPGPWDIRLEGDVIVAECGPHRLGLVRVVRDVEQPDPLPKGEGDE